MKILIAYASKSGTAKHCAALLQTRLPGSELCDLLAETPDPARYDRVVVGSGVRMGSIHKRARAFVRRYAAVIAARPHAFFITNSFTDQRKAILEASFPPELYKTAVAAVSFGGRIELDKLKGSDRLIAKMVAAAPAAQQSAVSAGIDEKKSAAFADVIRA